MEKTCAIIIGTLEQYGLALKGPNYVEPVNGFLPSDCYESKLKLYLLNTIRYLVEECNIDAFMIEGEHEVDTSEWLQMLCMFEKIEAESMGKSISIYISTKGGDFGSMPDWATKDNCCELELTWAYESYPDSVRKKMIQRSDCVLIIMDARNPDHNDMIKSIESAILLQKPIYILDSLTYKLSQFVPSKGDI